MELQVRGHGRPITPSLIDHTRRRVRYALDRFAPELRRVDVRLSDLNGPRGGVDQRCRVSLILEHSGPEIVAEDTDESMEVAIDRATKRVARRMSRFHSRRR